MERETIQHGIRGQGGEGREGTTAERPTKGNGEADQTPLQRMHQQLRERFGADIRRRPEEAARQQDRLNVQSLLQEGSPTTSTSQQEAPEERYRRMGKAPMTETTPTTPPSGGRERLQQTPPTTRYAGACHRPTTSPLGQPTAARTNGGRPRTTQANTPWRMWTSTEGAVNEVQTSQATLTATLDGSRRVKIDKDIRKRDQTDFGKKAWIQADKMISSWVTSYNMSEGTQRSKR